MTTDKSWQPVAALIAAVVAVAAPGAMILNGVTSRLDAIDSELRSIHRELRALEGDVRTILERLPPRGGRPAAFIQEGCER